MRPRSCMVLVGLLLTLNVGCGDDIDTVDGAVDSDVTKSDATLDGSSDTSNDTQVEDAGNVDGSVDAEDDTATDLGVDNATPDLGVMDANLPDASPPGETRIAFITTNNVRPSGASRVHQLHVVGPTGDYAYEWGNDDYVYTGNTIDMDTSDDAQLIVFGGGQGNINNKVLVFDYEGNKRWETGSNGNSQGTRFYTGNGAEPTIMVGYHDDTVDVSPTSSMRADALGFYARDLNGLLLDWRPRFTDGGGTAPFKGGGLNVWHFFADESNNRLFVHGEFRSVRTTNNTRVDVPVSRLAMYQQRANGSFPEEPTRVPRFGASWFETSAATKHVGNPWTMVQTNTHYYVGGHSFDRVEDLSGQVHNVDSLVRLKISDMDLDTSWLPNFGPDFNAATTDDSNCVVVRELARYGGEILVGGRFDAFQGSPRENLASFNATTGAISNRFSDLSINNGEVYSVAVDGNFAYISGTFTSITDSNGTIRRNRVACIDLTTNTVTDWNPNSSTRVNRVRVIHVRP